jgi:poly-gamma-glutamate capsule biosynthesis protein CapA/YwtB (metallophosphatase superfamily)
LTYAGAGLSLDEAAAPCYLDTANGRCALVSFASKVPVGSEATADRPGVNAVWMADMDSQKLNKGDVKRVIDSIATAAADADVVIAYQHNHYWEKSDADAPLSLPPLPH